jgi:hypothetical protein
MHGTLAESPNSNGAASGPLSVGSVLVKGLKINPYVVTSPFAVLYSPFGIGTNEKSNDQIPIYRDWYK